MHLFMRRSPPYHRPLLAFFLLAFQAPPGGMAATLQSKTLAAWEKYVRLTEQRVERDLQQEIAARPPGDGVQVTRMQTPDGNGKPISVPDGMIHHWKGSVFVLGVTLDVALKFVQDYNQHQRFFQEVERSRLLSRDGDTLRIFYRLKRKKVITVVYNTEHTVVYRRQGPRRASSRSASTKIAELEDPGKPSEKEKPVGEDGGYLWRANGYWRFEERDGGVIVEWESLSLSRNIPAGLGWLVKGFVESVPRESLVSTLTSVREGVRKQ